jgi:hypothetical protein
VGAKPLLSLFACCSVNRFHYFAALHIPVLTIACSCLGTAYTRYNPSRKLLFKAILPNNCFNENGTGFCAFTCTAYFFLSFFKVHAADYYWWVDRATGLIFPIPMPLPRWQYLSAAHTCLY